VGATCPNHPEVSAIGTCARCGAFGCAACLTDRAGSWRCASCLALEPVPGEAPLGFVVAWSVITLLAYLTIGGTLQFLHLTFGLWFGEVAIFAGAAVIGWQILRLRPLRVLGLTRFQGGAFALGLAFGLVNYVAWAVPTMALAQEIFPKSIVELFDSSKIFERQTQLELVLIVFGVSLAAPFGEEFFFRGFMQRGLQEKQGAPRAIVVTAVIFSAFHLDPVGFVARFELGVLFGLLAWKSGSIWPALGAHAANNAISSALFLSARGTELEREELPWYVPAAMFLVGNLALFALIRFAGPRLQVAEPSELQQASASRSVVSAFGPWVVGGGVSIAALLLVDLRGVQLNILDGLSQLPGATLKRPDVKSLRAEVRRGAAPVKDYEELLKSLK
jgi:membrane protease YdiL (CAAX protease family)